LEKDFERKQIVHELSRAALVENGSLRLKVTSYSMYPILAAGSFVVVEPKPPKNLRCGDIIVWDQGASWNTHRIVKIQENSCITKGDANWECDAPVEFKDILGWVTCIQNGTKSWEQTGLLWISLNGVIARLSAAEAFWGSQSGPAAGRIPPWAKSLLANLVRFEKKLLLRSAILLSKIR